MTDDVTSNGLHLRSHICRWTTLRARHDLVGNHHGHAMLISNALQFAQVSIQRLLSLCKLTPATVVGSKEPSGAVNDQNGISRFTEDARSLHQQPILVLRIVGASIGHVFQHVLFIQPVSSGNVGQTLRAEGAFGVNVHGLAFATSFADR
eukprot:Skav228433  [mRNA]  locus=scaffold1325:449192:454675:+ [translate_table: standard]